MRLRSVIKPVNTSQQGNAVAMGYQAGFTGQGSNAVAIGYQAGSIWSRNLMRLRWVLMPVKVIKELMRLRWVIKPVKVIKQSNAVAMGAMLPVQSNQGSNAVAMGFQAGNTSQGK
jgi:hypothetical protein